METNPREIPSIPQPSRASIEGGPMDWRKRRERLQTLIIKPTQTELTRLFTFGKLLGEIYYPADPEQITTEQKEEKYQKLLALMENRYMHKWLKEKSYTEAQKEIESDFKSACFNLAINDNFSPYMFGEESIIYETAEKRYQERMAKMQQELDDPENETFKDISPEVKAAWMEFMRRQHDNHFKRNDFSLTIYGFDESQDEELPREIRWGRNYEWEVVRDTFKNNNQLDLLTSEQIRAFKDTEEAYMLNELHTQYIQSELPTMLLEIALPVRETIVECMQQYRRYNVLKGVNSEDFRLLPQNAEEKFPGITEIITNLYGADAKRKLDYAVQHQVLEGAFRGEWHSMDELQQVITHTDYPDPLIAIQVLLHNWYLLVKPTSAGQDNSHLSGENQQLVHFLERNPSLPDQQESNLLTRVSVQPVQSPSSKKASEQNTTNLQSPTPKALKEYLTEVHYQHLFTFLQANPHLENSDILPIFREALTVLLEHPRYAYKKTIADPEHPKVIQLIEKITNMHHNYYDSDYVISIISNALQRDRDIYPLDQALQELGITLEGIPLIENPQYKKVTTTLQTLSKTLIQENVQISPLHMYRFLKLLENGIDYELVTLFAKWPFTTDDPLMMQGFMAVAVDKNDLSYTRPLLTHYATFPEEKKRVIYEQFFQSVLKQFVLEEKVTQEDLKLLSSFTNTSPEDIGTIISLVHTLYPDVDTRKNKFDGKEWNLYKEIANHPNIIDTVSLLLQYNCPLTTKMIQTLSTSENIQQVTTRTNHLLQLLNNNLYITNFARFYDFINNAEVLDQPPVLTDSERTLVQIDGLLCLAIEKIAYDHPKFFAGQSDETEYLFRLVRQLLHTRKTTYPEQKDSFFNRNSSFALQLLLTLPTMRTRTQLTDALDASFLLIPQNLFAEKLPFAELPDFFLPIAKNFDVKTYGDINKFMEDHKDYLAFFSVENTLVPKITKSDLPIIKHLHISLLEAEILKNANFVLADLEHTKDIELLIKTLQRLPDWYDSGMSENLKKGIELFGIKNMFKYVHKKGVTVHDTLYNFSEIIKLYTASGLTPNQFYANILSQVHADNSPYSEGSAYHYFNRLVVTANFDVMAIQEKLKEFADLEGLEKLKELGEKYKTPKDICASWNDFKRYSELLNLMERTDAIKKIQGLSKTNKPLFKYITELLFHEDSKVNIPAALLLAENPSEFFNKTASHTLDILQRKLSPTNYIHGIENLDLTAEELRDALVDGSLDTIQVFSPLEITYRIPLINGKMDISLEQHELVSLALGSHTKDIRGTAKQYKKLYTHVKRILREIGVSMEEYLAGKTIPKEQQERINTHLFNTTYGIPYASFTAKIHEKSSPLGALAGDDTANCMPFGDGKTTVYMWNPNTALFTIQLHRSDRAPRTIAESVLTKDIKIHTPFSRDMDLSRIHEIIPEKVLAETKAVFAADNVEVSPNYKSNNPDQPDMYAPIINFLYRDFARTYMEHFSTQQRLRKDKIVIGMGYADGLKNLPTEANEYSPQAPVSYSDKSGEEVYRLDLQQPDTTVAYREITASAPKTPETPFITPTITSLTFEDSVQVGWLEAKAYNQTPLQLGLLDMENTLIAVAISNAQKGRPNLGVKSVTKEGKMQGYLLGYEGKMDAPRGEVREPDQSVIYITDFVSGDSKDITIARNLLLGFLEQYKRNYIDKNNFVPIRAHMRDVTSYRLVKNGLLTRLARQLGLEFSIEEREVMAGEKKHEILITPLIK